jgi:hypothetical protein
MRMVLGLDAPTQGSVTVGGRSYRDLPAPMREVGALLDAKALVAVLLALTCGIIEGPGQGWASPFILACLAAAAVSLGGPIMEAGGFAMVLAG